MTLDRLLTMLRRRIARSHTTGGLSVVARELGLTRQTLLNIVTEKHTPTAETQAAITARLRTKRKG